MLACTRALAALVVACLLCTQALAASSRPARALAQAEDEEGDDEGLGGAEAPLNATDAPPKETLAQARGGGDDGERERALLALPPPGRGQGSPWDVRPAEGRWNWGGDLCQHRNTEFHRSFLYRQPKNRQSCSGRHWRFGRRRYE